MFGYKQLQKEFCMNLLCWTGDHRWAGQTLTGTWHKFPPSLGTLLMFVHYNPWYGTCPEQWAPMRFNIEQMSSCPNEGKRCPPPANTHTRDMRANWILIMRQNFHLRFGSKFFPITDGYIRTCSSTTARAKRVSASLRGWSAALTNTEILKRNDNHQDCLLKLGWLLVAELNIFQLLTCLCGVITVRSKHWKCLLNCLAITL